MTLPRRIIISIAYGVFSAIAFLLVWIGPSCEQADRHIFESGRSFAGDFLAARQARLVHDEANSIRYISRALSAAPDNLALLNEGYDIMLSSGKMAEAVQVARRLNQKLPELSSPYLLLATREAKYGRWDQTIAKLNEMRQHGDKANSSEANLNREVVAPFLQAWMEAAKKDKEKAYRLTEDLKQTAAVPFVLYQQALLADYSGDNAKALELYEQLSHEPALYLRVVQAAASFYLRNNQPARADEIKADFLRENPEIREDDVTLSPSPYINTPQRGFAEFLLEIGSFLYANQQYEAALQYIRLALFAYPDLPHAEMLMASIYKNQGQYAQAIQAYHRVTHPPVFAWAARLYAGRLLAAEAEKNPKNFARARRILRELAQEKQDRPAPLMTLGDLMLEHKNYAKASEYYGQGLSRVKKIEPYHWNIFYARGIAYERQYYYETDPQKKEALWQRAENDFKKALELKPNQPDVLNYLAYGWLIMGRNIEQAKQMLKMAITLKPMEAQIIDSFGWALYSLQDYEQAVEYLEEANLIMPYDPTINDHLGDVYWQLGRKKEARFQWQRALTFEPDPQEEPKIRRKLEEGPTPEIQE